MKQSIQEHNKSNLSPLAPTLRGLEDARTQRWTFCKPGWNHIFEPGPRQCRTWASGSASGNVQNELRKPLNEYFQTMQDSIRLRTCLRIASDATQSIFWGLAWLVKCPKLVSDTIFEEQANKNNENTNKEPYPEDEKAGTEPYPRGSKNMQNA